MTIPMPEPVARAKVYSRQDRRQILLTEIGSKANCELTWGEHDLITTTQAEAYKDACVRDALEEAAQACEARTGQHAPGMTPEDVEDCDEEARLCAGVIRALIPPSSRPG